MDGPSDEAYSHWHIWLKYKDRICPFLPDRRDLAPQLEFLDLIADSMHSYMFKVRIDDHIYALKLVRITRQSPSKAMLKEYLVHYP
ncbi:uncharacterized protein BO80DRAFT_18296 [Aspergillus ibericus CBS 121593]|uniref:Protein kinase domain-containing protein n=1 Tax=Aspergillus ibericus CBS 121593 TaxID=1448316 RepID=A0A395GHD2_9EURO|nr:hypothetical protein BO80DRAFT_18296 [Aspergillus ibericus CBS 121593]RAK94785.1 hypothetical protein BO80DRAFT_18296 [Aspergillus ibericus CBS 121593]